MSNLSTVAKNITNVATVAPVLVPGAVDMNAGATPPVTATTTNATKRKLSAATTSTKKPKVIATVSVSAIQQEATKQELKRYWPDPSKTYTLNSLANEVVNLDIFQSGNLHYFTLPGKGNQADGVVKSINMVAEEAVMFNSLKVMKPTKDIPKESIIGNLTISNANIDMLEGPILQKCFEYIYKNPSILGKQIGDSIASLSYKKAVKIIIRPAFKQGWSHGISLPNGKKYSPTLKVKVDLYEDGGWPCLNIFDENSNCVYFFPTKLNYQDEKIPAKVAAYQRVIAKHIEQYQERDNVLALFGRHLNANFFFSDSGHRRCWCQLGYFCQIT